MGALVLEITDISCENLRVTENPYVVVRAESLNSCTTKTAKNSGSKNSSLFSWNEKLLLNIPVHASSITFEVQCNRFKGLRPVGVARVAASDFLAAGESDEPENCLNVFSYRLKDWEGKGNGVIRFSVKVVVPEECPNAAVEPVNGTVAKKGSDDGVTGIHEVVIDVPSLVALRYNI